jgi:hypothetical protein
VKTALIALIIALSFVTLPWTIPRVHAWAYSGPDAMSVYRELAAKLSPGDSDEHIQEVLEQLDVEFSFDKFANRYKGIVRSSKRSVPAPAFFPGSMKCWTSVEVYLDDHGRFVRSEVLDLGDFL